MKTQKMNQLTLSDYPQHQIVLNIGTNEVFLLSVPILLISLFGFLFYKKTMKNQSQILAIVEESHKRMFQDLNRIHRQILQSNGSVTDAVDRSSLVPFDHALIPLQEGESLHSLKSGYVIKIERKFEHRAVAEAILGRSLAFNEIVHHIFAPAKENNSLENLCVMDRDQHDIFHTYIQREKDLKGNYPPISSQRQILKEHFGALMLEDISRTRVHQFPPIKPLPKHFQSSVKSKAT